MIPAFPQSGDENVEIQLTADKNDKILLHAVVLALHSRWFKASLSERWNGQDPSTTSKDGKNRWVYELRFDKGTSHGMLVRQSAASNALKASTELVDVTDPASLKLHKTRLACVEAHQQMLGALYHIVPFLHHDFTQDAQEAIMLLVKTADAYDCREVVNVPVDNHLRVHRTKVLDACAKTAVDMLELSIALQSDWIFKEAFVNIIGATTRNYNSMTIERLRGLGFAEAVAKKRREMSDELAAVDIKLLMIHATSSDESDYYDDIAHAFFRQWIAEQLPACNGQDRFHPSYSILYRVVGDLGLEADDDDLEEEVSCFLNNAQSSLIHDDLKPALGEIFNKARNLVQPIMKNATQRQDSYFWIEDECRVLSFMGIKDEDIPWKQSK